jgi:hypothetical protein
MAVNICASLIGMGYSLLSLFFIFRSITVFLNTAEQLRHSVAEERTNDLSSAQCCCSATIYVAESNIRADEMDEQLKKVYDGVTKNAIVVALGMRFGWYRNGDNFYSLFNFTSMVYSIITLASTDMNAVTEANLIIYVVIVGLSEFTLLLGCLLVALSPLICLALCVFCCCCRSEAHQPGAFINIPTKEATLGDIVNAGGNCSICYQSINEKERIYVLLCSDKHVFHCECLKHWTKVKNNCPICRQDIPMADRELHAEAIPESQPQ